MKLTKKENLYLIKIIGDKSKRDITESLTISSVSMAILQRDEKRPIWEIKDYSKKIEYIKKEVKKVFIQERRIAKRILNKLKSSYNHGNKKEIKQ